MGGVVVLKLKLMSTSFRPRVILRALVIVCAFSVVSVLRNLGGAYEGNGLFANRFLKPIWNYLESEKCKEDINLTSSVVRELIDMNLLRNDSKALCIGRRSVSAVLAMNLQGISDTRVAYLPPVLAFKNRKLTSELHYQDASFDFFLSMDLETVSVSASLVYEIERILKSGGTGAMLVGTTSDSDSNGLVRSVSPISSLLKNSSVVHIASFGKQSFDCFHEKW